MDTVEFDRTLSSMSSEGQRIDFIRKYFFHGTPYVFKERENDYFEFRNKIAKHFDISFNEVFIVGSGKFGFSYLNKTEFSFESDIDVAIVNEKLFDYFFSKICDYQYTLDKMHRLIDLEEKKLYAKFLRYMIKGWMRPDMLPVSFKIRVLKQDWFDYFKSISHGKSEVGNYKVTSGLYRNHYYLEKYYRNQIESYYKELEMRNM